MGLVRPIVYSFCFIGTSPIFEISAQRREKERDERREEVDKDLQINGRKMRKGSDMTKR